MIPTGGNVRTGMWVRGACVNDSLVTGSMIRYIEEAFILGFSIILLNPNISVNGNRSPADHIIYAYDHFISKSVSSSIVFSLHQIAGDCLVHLLRLRPNSVNKIGGFVFIDPTHSVEECSNEIKNCINVHGRTWVSSPTPRDTPRPECNGKFGCETVSTGNPKFVMSPFLVMPSIFAWLKQKPSIKNKLPTENVIQENRKKWEDKERIRKQKHQ